MKKYDVLLFDVDGTLLDFDRAEEMGIEGLLEYYGVPVTAENKEKYHHLNKSYWERRDHPGPGLKPAVCGVLRGLWDLRGRNGHGPAVPGILKRGRISH